MPLKSRSNPHISVQNQHGGKAKKKKKNEGKVIHAKDVSYVEQKPQLIRAKQHHSPFILSLNVTPDEQKIQQYFTFPSSQHAHSHIETASFCIQ